MQTINSQSGTLYGISVLDQINVATAPTTVAAHRRRWQSSRSRQLLLTDTRLRRSHRLVDEHADRGEAITFTLNGSENCSATTDDSGTASCVITPGEPSSSYTLTASFPGDSSQLLTPIGWTAVQVPSR